MLDEDDEKVHSSFFKTLRRRNPYPSTYFLVFAALGLIYLATSSNSLSPTTAPVAIGIEEDEESESPLLNLPKWATVFLPIFCTLWWALCCWAWTPIESDLAERCGGPDSSWAVRCQSISSRTSVHNVSTRGPISIRKDEIAIGMANTSSLTVARPLHLVCLHGYCSSASFMEMQLAKLGLLNEERYRLTYLEAPYESTESFNPLMKSVPGETYRQWFSFGPNDEIDIKEAAVGVDMAIKNLLEIVEKEDAIDGIIGFSQGATIAVSVCSRFLGVQNPPLESNGYYSSDEEENTMRERLSQAIEKLPTFVVCISGVSPTVPVQLVDYTTASFPLGFPCVSILGTNDQYYEESEGLSSLFASHILQRICHSGGHDLSTFPPSVQNELVHWLETVGRELQGHRLQLKNHQHTRC